MRVGAGAIGWDVRDFVATFGYEMPVYNGGWAGPTIGGYLSAGGMGLRVPPDVRARWLAGDPASAEAPLRSISEAYGGFWEHVAAVTLVDGTGTVHEIDERDDVFPWLFGSYGQFGVVADVTLKLRTREARSYPAGEQGRVPRVQREDVSMNDRPPAPGGDRVLCWFSFLVDQADEPAAWRELAEWVDRHAPYLQPAGGLTGPARYGAPIGYRYVVTFGRFNPPLLYPRAGSFVLLGLMAPFAGIGTVAGDEPLLAAERDFGAIATRRGFRLYPQAENIGRTLDYARYYGAEIFETFVSLKRRFDPDGVINPGTVFPSSLRPPARTSEAQMAEQRMAVTERPPQTLAVILDRCGGSFTRQLVDGAAAAALGATCERLPALLTGFWGVETRLGDVRPEVDLLIEIKRGSAGHALLAGAPDGRRDADDLRARLPAIDRIATSPAWRAARGFARRWLDSADALHRGVRNVWLEFDLVAATRAGSAAQAVERPSIFWGPDPDAPSSTRALIESIAEAFPVFPADVPLDTLDRAVRSLPEGARVFQIGAMDLRGDVRLRLCVNRLAPDAMASWLTSIGWPGDGAALDAFVRRVGPLATRFALDIDLTPTGVGPKAGLECYRTWGELDSAQWAGLLDVIDSEGLVAGAKRAAVDAFPATTRLTSAEHVPQGDGSYIHPVLVRDVHHIKVGFERDRPTDAKGYLGVYRPGVNLRSARARA